MSTAVEQDLRLRAAVFKAKAVLDKKKWEDPAPARVGHVWVAVRDSLYEQLISARDKGNYL